MANNENKSEVTNGNANGVTNGNANGVTNGNGNGKFKNTVESLVSGMENFLSTKTVVGDPITVGDTIILPLVDVTFGVGAGVFAKNGESNSAGGGLGAKMNPSAVLVITNGTTRLINVKNSTGIDKVLDMVPDFVEKFTSFAMEKTADKKVPAEDRREAEKAMEETIIEASRLEDED